MEVFVTHGFARNSTLIRRLVEAGAEEVHSRMVSIAHEAEAEIEGLISQKLHPREGFRRKDGDEHLAGSIRVEVDWNGHSFPINVEVTSDADEAKVASLEFGARPHGIDGNPFLVFPSNRISRGGGQTRGVFGRGFQATGSGKNFASFGAPAGRGSRGGSSSNLTKTPHVNHPGNPAFHFMRKGLDRAIRRALGAG